MNRIEYTKENLQKLCQESSSLNEVIIKSGRVKGGNNIIILKKYIEKYHIDISHFTSSTSNKKTKNNIISLTKVCLQCGQEKNIQNDFYWSKGYARNICKECVKKNEKEKYQKKQTQLIDFKKTLKCKKCGDNRFYILDFHHRNPEEKEYGIADNSRISFEKIQEEIKKCDCLCANCHREWHYLNKINPNFSYQDWITDNADMG